MKRTLYIIILTVIISSCSDKKKSNKGEITIRNIDKLEILNEILSDTIDLKLLPYQRVLISDFNFLPKLPMIIEKEGESISVNYIKYLSHNLIEKDTLFIKEQIEQNKAFDLKTLSKYNFQVLNTSELLKKGISIDSLSSIAYKRTASSDRSHKESYFLIDKPIFNKRMNRMCLSIHRPNSGEDFVFIRKNGKWKKTPMISRWTY